MQIIDTVAVVMEQDRTTVRTEITSESVTLEALCAYRDKLILSDDWDTLEVTAKLMLIEAQIKEIWNSIPVR